MNKPALPVYRKRLLLIVCDVAISLALEKQYVNWTYLVG